MTNKTKQYITLLFLFIIGFTPIKAQSLRQPHSSSIYALSDFDKAVACIKFYEGLHTKKDYPYIGYGHCIQPGEKLNWSLTKKQADALLRSDLKKLCAIFRGYGVDSLLLATLSYNVGCGRILGNGKYPKSKLLRKIEAGDRKFHKEYLEFCKYKGKRIASIQRRRYTELRLLYQIEYKCL
ncbi:glycoside hydrolase family protein [Bacteroides thetaiotaomicron]|uniref:glycoside hydrolase family protein n=1 Tax=Bacteroides thetaiotaomicron TaxID=818 RepID=UPI004063B967